MSRTVLCACLLAAVAAARADGTVLRLSTPAPDGTAWSRELRAFARDVERRTEGRVRVKWYWGSIAGGESEVAQRIQRRQLEGAGSGGPMCAELMPSLRVLQFPGLFQNAAEAKYVVNQLSAVLAAESEQAGFTNLGSAPLGSGVFLGTSPVGSLAELRNFRIWIWDDEPILISLLREMGLKVVPTPVERAAREFDAGKFDAFWVLPTAALAFQWSTQARQLVNLHGEYLYGCILLANRTFAALSADDQREVKAAGAQLRDRIDEVSRQQETALLAGAFQHQGVKVHEPSEKLRAEFFAAANAARDRLGASLVPSELLLRVRGLLSDYRAEHEGGRP